MILKNLKIKQQKSISQKLQNILKAKNCKKKQTKKLQNISVRTCGFNRWVLVSLDHRPSMVQVSWDTLYNQFHLRSINNSPFYS